MPLPQAPRKKYVYQWWRMSKYAHRMLKRVAADMDVRMIQALETLLERESRLRGIQLPERNGQNRTE